jgi:hypothetical protein
VEGLREALPPVFRAFPLALCTQLQPNLLPFFLHQPSPAQPQAAACSPSRAKLPFSCLSVFSIDLQG